jgi:hypothetical protein
MADYLSMKSYLEKSSLHYFNFSPNSEKAIKAVIHHLPPDTPVEDISSSLEDLGSIVIKVNKWPLEQHPTKPLGNPPSLPYYLKKKHKLSRDIEAE